MRRKFTLLRGEGRPWRDSVPAPLLPGFQHTYYRWLYRLRRLSARLSGVSRRLSRALALRDNTQAPARRMWREQPQATSLAPHVTEAARERAEERDFRETMRAHSAPAASRAAPGVIRSAQAQVAPSPNAKLPICVLQTPPSFTASVMARVAATAESAPASAPPGSLGATESEVSRDPASPTYFSLAAPYRALRVPGAALAASPRVSPEMLWRHLGALIGAYSLAALIVLCSGWLFAVLAPQPVFAALNAAVDAVIVALTTLGALWQTANGAVGGLGILYALLLLLLAPILLALSQAPRAFASAQREA